MICTLPHTKFQPTTEQWRCPRCDAVVEFYVDGYNGDEQYEAFDCDLLHTYDVVVCDKCSWQWTGRQLANALAKKYNQVKCPHCHGTGFIPKEQADV